MDQSPIIQVLFLTLILAGAIACGGAKAGDDTASADASAASENATASRAATDGVTCRQLGVGNYNATFSNCSDGRIWALLCKEKGGNREVTEYECSCEIDDEQVANRSLDHEPYKLEISIPDQTRKNATAAANEICDWQLAYGPLSSQQ